MLTPEQLAEIWERWQDSHDGEWSSFGRNIVYRRANGGGLIVDTKMGFRTKEDAAFAAHAHQDIPALVMEVERLQSELANAAAHAEVQILQAKEAAYNDVIEYLYAWYYTLTIVGVIEVVKGLRDKVQRQQAGKDTAKEE